MDGFERRREAKKKAILQAAIELFCTKGVKDANIADIAKKANVSQVSIYNFFESKDNLAKQAFMKYMDEKMDESERLLLTNLPFPEKFKELILESNKAGENLNEEFFQSYVWNDPGIQGFYREYYHSRSIRLILNLIEQGKSEGYVDSTLSTDAILLYIGMFNNVLAQPGLSKDIRLDFSKLFFYGILGKQFEQSK
jgi:AcrR family transcriptional regulator